MEVKDLEGEKVLPYQLRNLAVDILVYDNHVQLAESLKVIRSLVFQTLFLWPVFCLENTSENASIQFCCN